MAIALTDLKVLVVEDNKSARNLMKIVLGGIGITQIYAAEDGKVALNFLGEAPELVDLIVCDWQMPRMTGLELLQQVRTVHPNMPFMMVTGKADISSVKAAKEFGVNAYLSKPYSPQQLEQNLLRLVRAISDHSSSNVHVGPRHGSVRHALF